jgi:D-alanyl-D-alanine carboxypeptidase
LPHVDIPADIRLIHLLRHTSGLRDYGPLPEYHRAVRSRPDQPWTGQEFLEVGLSKGTLFPPGKGWAYSNIGYMLLRQVVECALGQGFTHILQELLKTPLELQQTFVLERIEDWSTCVPGYGSEVDLDGRIVDIRAVYHPGWCAPGVVASNAEDVTLVFDALLSGKFLKAETLKEMLTLVPVPGSHPSGMSPSCGMGILSDLNSPWGPNYGHGGAGAGYDLSVTVFPETRLGRVALAIFVNSSFGPRAKDCEAELLSRFLGDVV